VTSWVMSSLLLLFLLLLVHFDSTRSHPQRIIINMGTVNRAVGIEVYESYLWNIICTQPSSLSQQTPPLLSEQEQSTSNHKQCCRSQTQQL